MTRVSVVKTTLDWVHEHCAVPKEVDASFEVWKVMDGADVALVVGFKMSSLLGYADMWIVPLNLTRRILRCRKGLMDLARDHYPRITAHVEGERNQRFAEFFGFAPVRPVQIDNKTVMRMEWQPHSQ